MAPKRRSTDEANSSTIPTRRSSRLAANLQVKDDNNKKDPEQSKKKKPKKSLKEKQPPAPEEEAQEEVVDGDAEVVDGDAEVVDGDAGASGGGGGGGGPAAGKTIIIEHCKQCTQFKIRAVKVKGGLEKAVEGVNVVVNPEKPRRGCFEIREENGETFISLLDMKRPFKPMRDLDMDQVITDIIEKIK